MAVSQLPQAPYRQDRKTFPTPIVGDVLFSEVRDGNRSELPEYGTPHPNTKKWPDHKLVFIKPVDIERNEIFEFFYAAERENQDLYNFSSGLQGIGPSRQFRVVQRSYVTLRENFQPLDIPFGMAMPNIPEDKFEGIEYVFFDRQQQRIDQQELDSLFVAEVHTYVERAFLDEKLSYSAEKTDPIPEKFQVLVPQQVTEELVEGTAEMPTLTGSQLSVKEDQINPDIKLVRTVSRDRSSLPVSLDQKATTNDKQLASISETIQSGDTLEQPSATVDIESTALGDGTYSVRKVEVPEVFAAELYSVERPDRVPEKFRATLPTTTEEFSEVGQAEEPQLSIGELAATEQQQNKFIKRKRKVKRDVTLLPQTITQKATANDKQVITVTEKLQVGDTTEAPSATVDIESEALGDGTYIVRKTQTPKIFAAEVYSSQKPDVTPEKFKANLKTKTVQTNKEGKAQDVELSAGQLQRTQQQINEFVYQEQIVTREQSESADTELSGTQTYVGGTLATIKESLHESPVVADSGYLIQESRVSPLGDNKYIKETISVEQWPTLLSGEWDENINGLSVKKQEIISATAANSVLTTNFDQNFSTSYEAINKDRTVKISQFAPKEIDTYLKLSQTRINLTVPPVLKNISIQWDEDQADGSYSEAGASQSISITDGTVSKSSSGNVSGSAGATPILDINMDQIWANDLVATNYFYFVKQPNSVLGRLNVLLNNGDFNRIKTWPIFKPTIFTVTAVGKSVSATAKWSSSQSKSVSIDREAEASSAGAGSTGSVDTNLDITKIGPCLCKGFTISGITSKNLTAKVSGTYSALYNSIAQVYPITFPSTSPSDIPRSGQYLIDSRVDPYKWGYFKVIATVIDASQLA